MRKCGLDLAAKSWQGTLAAIAGGAGTRCFTATRPAKSPSAANGVSARRRNSSAEASHVPGRLWSAWIAPY